MKRTHIIGVMLAGTAAAVVLSGCGGTANGPQIAVAGETAPAASSAPPTAPTAPPAGNKTVCADYLAAAVKPDGTLVAFDWVDAEPDAQTAAAAALRDRIAPLRERATGDVATGLGMVVDGLTHVASTGPGNEHDTAVPEAIGYMSGVMTLCGAGQS